MMRHGTRAVTLISFLCFLCLGIGAQVQTGEDALMRGFTNPPNSAKPRVWWHWMNGNITKEGIKLDLEWMNRIGLGGFQTFDAALGTPQVVEKRLVYMRPDWKDAFLYATRTAERLGLEEAIAGSPGWSETGGPWVSPAHGMKKFVWSETRVEGGKPFTGILPKPPSTTGPFQNIVLRDFLAALTGGTTKASPEYFADSAVIAYRAPDSDVRIEDLGPKVTSSGGNIDVPLLSDGDLVKTTELPIAPTGQQSWIQYEFSKPQTMHAVSLVTHGGENPMDSFIGPQDAGRELQSSDDGQKFSKVVSIPFGGAPQHTVAFPEVTARFFRVTFTTQPPRANPFGDIDVSSFGFHAAPPPTDYHIAELALYTRAAVNRFEEKAAFTPLPDLYAFATPPVSDSDAIRKADVVILTSKLQPNGTLNWTPPAGKWVVLRMGYSLLGITNHPASPEATGLEVDKLNRDDVKAYMDTYLDNYKSAAGSLMGKRGVRYMITDSWEAGAQNWTDNMIEEFTKRRGYDPRPWMPVLTGRVIESSEASDRFLWDFRKTIADLTADYHYGQIEASLHARGMGHYGESHEQGRAFIADGMEVKKDDDVPMGAMWTQPRGINKEQYGYDADIRESASVAHIYGQNLVAAESLTSATGPWAWAPAMLKPTADKELAMGLNRFVIHCSVHQPLIDKAPGLTLGPFGQWFTRNETWAEEATPWISYLARSSFLLQQGRFAADIIYFYGEDSNITAIFANKSPAVPAGYNFDYVNADALIHKVLVRDGRIVTPSGMNYRVLALDPRSQHMSLPVLRRIRDLVKEGAVVVGLKPTSTPSLADSQAEFGTIADQLWGSEAGGHVYGKGKVYASEKLSDALTAMKIAPDFEHTTTESDTNLLFVHRKLTDGDLYYVDNPNPRVETVDATFRVQGKAAEFWHADSGKREPAAYRIDGGRTTVPLHLNPYETVFVVFRKPARTMSLTLPHQVETPIYTLEGSWNVSFQAGRGAPEAITLNSLTSWSENSDERVKYFSGTGTYTKTIQAAADWFKTDTRLWLDLGDVKDVAQVAVNGKPLGILWKPPYKVDVTSALHRGANEVTIKVTNLWVNRLIGDQQPNISKKYTFTVIPPYKASSPLLSSGLLGPVQISSVSTEKNR